MDEQIFAAITGTGSYIPTRRIPNDAFLDRTFLNPNGEPYERSNEEIVNKFEKITGIKERRYASDGVLASDMAASAGEKALTHAGIDGEKLDYIIVAHNFGDVRADNPKVDMVPSLASRVKHKLAIDNPNCIAYDLPFGCPGWVQGLTQANYYIKSGDAQRALVIGSETLSRVCDPHDRDSMIYADGAGATVLEATTDGHAVGILSHAARSDANPEADYLTMDTSFGDNEDDNNEVDNEDDLNDESHHMSHQPGQQLCGSSSDSSEVEEEVCDEEEDKEDHLYDDSLVPSCCQEPFCDL